MISKLETATKSETVTKDDSMDLAEDSRQEEWHHPSFVAELFAGNLCTDLIDPFLEQPKDDKKIGDEFLERLEKFIVENIDADSIDENQVYPREILEKLKDFGAFGMKIAKKYGGEGLSQTNYVRAIAMLSGHCGNTVGFLSAHQSIGAPQPLHYFGTEEQKKKFLPRLTKEISAFALTEPDVGSDPARMTTTATPSADSKTWEISGTKLWCTNGAIADVIIVMARTPDKIIKGKARKQISAFLVEKDMPGFSVEHRCMFMGLNGFENALLKFDKVIVPAENMIGEEGGGLKLAFVTLNAGRLSLPGACVGLSKKCLEIIRYWTKERQQWGTNIGNHEEIAHKTGELAAAAFAMEAMTYWTCQLVDRGGADIRLEAAIAKLFCTEQSWHTTNQTLQTRGGRGYERAPSLKARGETAIGIERMLRDIRINTILEGSTEIMHLFIAREALDMHMRLAKPLIKGGTAGEMFATLLKCAAFYAVWYPKQWFTSITSYLPFFGVSFGKLAKHMRYVKRNSAKLARAIFHLMILNGPKLEYRQMALGRVVEIGSELFAMSTSCARAKAMLKKNPDDRSPEFMADLFCRQARQRINSHFKTICCNSDKQELKASKMLMKGDLKWMEDGKVRGNISYPEHFDV